MPEARFKRIPGLTSWQLHIPFSALNIPLGCHGARYATVPKAVPGLVRCRSLTAAALKVFKLAP